MNLPAENASTAELKTFAASLGDDRRLRLAAALLAPSMEEAEDKDDEDDDYLEAVNTLASAATEFDIVDSDFQAFCDAVYSNI